MTKLRALGLVVTLLVLLLIFILVAPVALTQPGAGQQVAKPVLATDGANVPSATGQALPASAHTVFVRKKGAAGRAEASNVSFLPAVTYVTGGPQTNASSLAVADVNGDGKPDLIVANVVTSCCGGVESIGVLLGNGDGTFQSPIVITSVSQIGEFNALAVADVNRDGKPDLIVTTCCASNGDNQAAVLLGNGDGTFQSPVLYDLGGTGPSIAAADVNGDGKPDIISANWNGSNNSTVTVLLGNGDGTFQPPIASPAPDDPGCLTIADVNSDGKPDALICSENTVAVLLGNGDGTFQGFNNTNFLTGYCTNAAAVSDLAGNGILDMIAPNQGGGGCNPEGFAGVLLGDGNGNFQTEVEYEVGADTYAWMDVAVADFNGDGKPDVAVSSGLYVPGVVAILLGNGDGTFQPAVPFSTGAAGSCPIVAADFNGDGWIDIATANFNLGGVSVLINSTGGLSTTSTLTSSTNPSAYGQSVTFTATVTSSSGTPTGTVVFYDGSTAIGSAALANGSTSISTSSLPLGSNSITAAYQGSGGFLPSTSAVLTQVVNANTTATSLSSSLNPSLYSQSVSFVAMVTSGFGTPIGTVIFYNGTTAIGSAALSNGSASVSTSSLPIGSNSITAAYQGSSGFAPSTSTVLTQIVNLAKTTTALASSVNPVPVDKWVTYTATVTSQYGTATGTVTFQDNGATVATVSVSNNQATFTTKYKAAGVQLMTATYSGDSNNLGSTSSVFMEEVGKVPYASETTVGTSGSPSLYGQPVTFTATVTSKDGAIPDGETVTFYARSEEIGTGTTNGGVATFTTSSLAGGTYTIKAEYSGDATFKESSGTVRQVVSRYATTTTISSSPNPSTYGQTVTWTATVTSTGPYVPTGKVRFIGIHSAMLSGGVATLSAICWLNAGTYAITAKYEGDEASEPSTSAALSQVVNPAATTTTVTSSANPSSQGQSVTFTATVTTSTGVNSAGTVTFTAGGTTLGTATLSANVASVSTSALPVGTTVVLATYNGETDFTGSSGTVTQTVNP